MKRPEHVVLQCGRGVMYDGQPWVILEVDEVDRVLARRIEDGRREFLPVDRLKPLPQESKAMADLTIVTDTDEAQRHVDADLDAPSQVDADGPLDGEHLPEASNWKRFVGRRQLRVVPPAHELDKSTEKQLEQAVDVYQSARRIADEPDRSQRAKLVAELAKQLGKSHATVYRYVQFAETYRSAEAFLRAQRSDKGKPRRSKATLDVIESRLATLRFVAERRTIDHVLEVINGDLRALGQQEVSRTYLYRHMHQLKTRRQQLISEGRLEQVRNQYKPKVGHLPDIDYPLSVVQIDHTPCQVCLVDSTTRRPIGDAWLTLVIDCYSRMVLSFYLSFDAPSSLNVGLALARAMLPKEEFLQRMGVKGKWPCWGVPDVILVDNAAELNGYTMHRARRRYRFTIRNRPVGMPNIGGHVESAFKTFMSEFKGLPGTKFSNPKERAEYDSEGNAVLTIDEFERLFTEFLVNDYHLDEHSGIGMDRRAPLQRWTAGVFDGDVLPPKGLPDRPADPDQLRISLMPVEERTIRNGRINLFSETYYSGALVLMSNQVDLTKHVEERRFEIRYDPRDISRIWVLDPATDEYIEAHFSDLGKGSISLWEHNARKKALGRPADEYKEVRYRSKLRRHEMVQETKQTTLKARREAERERRSQDDRVLAPKPPGQPKKPAAPAAPLSPERIAAMRQKVRPPRIDDD